MLLNQLKNEINQALNHYIKKFPSYQDISPQRQTDIAIIKDIMRGTDIILMINKLHTYLNTLASPFLCWLTIFDTYNFVNTLKQVLTQDKFKEINLLRALIREKEMIIASFPDSKPHTSMKGDSTISAKLDTLITDIQLLKKENEYLYKMIEQLDTKISLLEKQNKTYLDRAIRAENELTNTNKGIYFHEKTADQWLIKVSSNC